MLKSAAKGGFSEFRRQLEYEARGTGALVMVGDESCPSSKTCPCCGVGKAEPALSQRTFHCDSCGHEADRDQRGAISSIWQRASR